MSRARQVFALLLAAALAAGAGFLVRSQTEKGAPDPGAAGAILASSFADLQGARQPLSQWKGQVLVVNFWATWCPPCREEIPGFIRLQEKYRNRGVVFVGIALDEKDKVQEFSRQMGINYPILIGDGTALDLARQAGDRAGGLPFTAIIDRRGSLALSHLGALNRARLEPILLSQL